MITLFQTSLVLHIAGIVMIAGTTFTNFFISKQFWTSVETDKPKAIIINSTTLLFGRLTGIGGAITILSGFGMLAALRGVVASQLWFQIKMALVLFIILNASLVAGAQNKKLQTLLSANNSTVSALSTIKSNLNIYYAIQFLLLIIIFILSVFKFG